DSFELAPIRYPGLRTSHAAATPDSVNRPNLAFVIAGWSSHTSRPDAFLCRFFTLRLRRGFMPAYSLSCLSEHSTLIDLLAFRESQPTQSPDDAVFTFLETGEGDGETLTFASLDMRARSIAAHLRQSSRPGDRILLAYPPGIEFIVAFWGCV